MTYLRIGIVIAFLAVISVALWYRGEAISATRERDLARIDLKVAEDANAAQQATIGRLRAEAEANDKLVTQMAADIAAIRDQAEETTQAIGELKNASAAVLDYLGTLVPPELEQLLNK